MLKKRCCSINTMAQEADSYSMSPPLSPFDMDFDYSVEANDQSPVKMPVQDCSLYILCSFYSQSQMHAC